jgi:phage shock protein A
MGLIRRISDLLRSNINDLISRAEDPEKMLNAAIDEMQKQLVEAKSRVAMSIADEKRLEKQYDAEQAKSEEWEAKAMTAVRAGRDDLAVEALQRKKEHQAAASQFFDQLESQRSAVDELKRALSELTGKLEETRRKRTLLLARSKRAEAQRQLAATLSNRSHTSALERLERLEAQVEREEAQAEANWEFAAIGPQSSYERDLAKEIDALGAGPAEDELLALKAKVESLDAETEALPPGQPAPLPSPSGSNGAAPSPEAAGAEATASDDPEAAAAPPGKAADGASG